MDHVFGRLLRDILEERLLGNEEEGEDSKETR